MKRIRTEDAVGHVLCHDMTQIIPGVSKGPRFRKGHVVTEEDIPVLLSMGKENLFVWEMEPGMVHENDAAERLAALCGRENMTWSESERRKNRAEEPRCEGVFLVDSARLCRGQQHRRADDRDAARRRARCIRATSSPERASFRSSSERKSCGRPSRRQAARRCCRSRPFVRRTAAGHHDRQRGRKGTNPGQLHAGRRAQARRPSAFE